MEWMNSKARIENGRVNFKGKLLFHVESKKEFVVNWNERNKHNRRMRR
jgi:hypothetical protein